MKLSKSCCAALSLCGALLLTAACHRAAATTPVQFINPDGSSSPVIAAEVAHTSGRRSLGLMYRKELGADAGMLFIFEDDAPRTFWMKNTYLELDMIFIDRSLRVVSIVERATPLSEQPRKSGAPCRYVVEVRGGMAAKWGVKTGSVLRLEAGIAR